MVQIQYASDLHINDWAKHTPFSTFLTPAAPILVLAGDICSAWDPLYAQFLAWVSRHWQIVVLITGNHEYYCDHHGVHTMEETDAHICYLAQSHPNIAFLQNGASYIVPGTRLRFVGATYWSAIDPAIWDEIAGKKGDYKTTYTGSPYGPRKTHPSDNCARHAYQKAAVRSACAPLLYAETLIVVTHHMPTLALLEPEYRGERWHSCYATADDDMFSPNIHAWICGHSHRAVQLQVPGGPRLLMNARGYNRPHEIQRTQDVYHPRRVVEVQAYSI